jgi:hypothetical protein
MQRWIARLLALIMVVPVFGPLALASAVQPQSPHCLRQPAKPAMQCHPGMTMVAELPSSETSETSFRAADSCCQNHDCCRGMGAPRWAQPQSQLLSHQGLPTAEAILGPAPELTPSSPANNDSARAPPPQLTL